MSKIHTIQWESDFQRAVVIGMLLGDGSLSHANASINYHLACYHSEKQLEWLEQKHQWLGELARPIQRCSYLDKRDGKTRSGGRFHTISAPILTELHTLFYPHGKKCLSQEAVATICEPVTLAILIGDDGSWHRAVRIASKQFSLEENENLANQLNLAFSLHCYVEVSRYSGKLYYSIYIPAQDVLAVRSLCMPYLPQSLHYKLGGEVYTPYIIVGKITYTCEKCGKQVADYPSARRRFCSRSCRAASTWIRKGRRVECKCDNCQKPCNYSGSPSDG
jgi:hypothetical protein